MTGDCRNCIMESFMISAPHQNLSGCQIKEDKINRGLWHAWGENISTYR